MSDDFTADMTVPIILLMTPGGWLLLMTLCGWLLLMTLGGWLLLMTPGGWLLLMTLGALREKSSQTNVILQYKLLASILSAFCCVIQQS